MLKQCLQLAGFEKFTTVLIYLKERVHFLLFFQVKVWFQNRRMKWRHQESKDRRGEVSGNGNPAPFAASDVIMQCDVTGNDLAEEEEEELVMDDYDDEEEADSTADREISSTRL